jgi:hypothetical protein
MKKHLDILTILNFSLGKIDSDEIYIQIIEHLGECQSCMQLFRSHQYLAENAEDVLDSLVSDSMTLVADAEDELTPEAAQPVSTSPKALNWRKHLNSLINGVKSVSEEIKKHLSEIVREVNLSSDLQYVLITVKSGGPQGKLLSTDAMQEREISHLPEHIVVFLIPSESYVLIDFSVKFTGKFFYFIYEKEDFGLLIGRKVFLSGNLEEPILLESTFKEGFEKSVATFEIDLEKMLAAKNEIPGEAVNKLELYVIIDSKG